MSYNNIANDIIKNIGGWENVSSLSHCMTRLRFVLKDESITNDKNIENIEGVMGLSKQGGQYQVIIGPHVKKVYDCINKESEVEDSISEVETKNITEKKQSVINNLLKLITKVFTPLLPVIAGIGLINGILAIMMSINLTTTESTTYQVISSISQSIFYFFPVFIGACAANTFGMNQFVGMMIGAVMIHPNIIGMANIEGLTFLSIPMNVRDYTSTVFPVLAAVWACSKLDKVLRKYVPDVLQMILVGPIELLIIIPSTLIVIGPIMNSLSDGLANASLTLFNFSSVIFGFILGGAWPLIVAVGLHYGFLPIIMNNFSKLGYEPMSATLTANGWAVTGALLAFAIYSKIKIKNRLVTQQLFQISLE